MKTSLHKANYDKAVEIIRALALSIDSKELTIQTLTDAILSTDAGRSALSKELECKEYLLKTVTITENNTYKDKPSVEWPQDLFDEEDDDLLIDNLFSENNESKSKADSDTNDKEPKFIDIDILAEAIVENQEKNKFFNKLLFLSLEELQEKTEEAKKKLIKLFPEHNLPIHDLLDLIYIQHSKNFAVNRLSMAFPVFIYTYEDNYLYKILEQLAKLLKCKFEYFTTENESTSNFYEKLNQLPKTLATIQLFEKTENNEKLEPLLLYYETGINKKILAEKEDSFFGLTMNHDFEETLGSIKNLAVQNIIVFCVTIPDELRNNKYKTTEELSGKILNYFQRKYQDTVIHIEYFKRLLKLSNNHNSVVFGKLNYRVIKNNVKLYLKSISFDMDKLSSKNFTLLVNLTILYTGGFKGAKLINALDYIILKTGIQSMNPAKIKFEIKNNLNYLGDILNHGETEQNEALYQNFFENMEKSNKKISFNISANHQNNTVIISDFTEYSGILTSGSHYLQERPQLRFSDVVGLNEIKKRFEIIKKYYKNPDAFFKLNMSPNNRILLTGKPGTGKTLITKAFAGEMSVPFFYISASEITSQKYAGFGGSLLREVFQAAKSMSPCILFLDEIDAIGNRNSISDDSTGFDAKSIINTLLVELDGINTENDIIVVGATNRPQDIDPALIRPKRFGTILSTDNFSTKDRYNMISMKLKPENCSANYKKIINTIVKRTDNDFTPAILEQIVYEAKLNALNHEREKVTLNDINESMDGLILGRKIKDIALSFKKTMAYHQAGHALLHKILFNTKTIEKLSISIYQNSLGNMEVKNDDAHISQYTADELVKIIIVQMAGAIAESIKFGTWGLNAEEDWELVSLLAAKIIGNLGMEKSLKPIIEHHLSDTISEGNLKRIEELIQFAFEFAKNQLQDNWIDIELLAKQLSSKGELTVNQIETLLKGITPYNKDLFTLFNQSIETAEFNEEP